MRLAIDQTIFNTATPLGERVRCQILRIAEPRKGRALLLLLLQLAYNRDRLPAERSQNQLLEQDALLAVVKALPKGVRPVVLADRGFRRASFPHWLERHGLRYVVRLKKGTCIIQEAGLGWKVGREGLSFGELRFRESVHYGLYHGRPHDVRISVVLCWRVSESKARNARRRAPEESWYLATNLAIAKAADSWYWQRGWVEQSLKDSMIRFDLKRVRVSSAERLSRLLMALTISLCWLTLMALPEIAHRPEASDRR